MSGRGEKTRAVVLTAIMVVSVVATGLAFTGGVAAADSDYDNIKVSSGDGLQQAINQAQSGDTVTVTDSATYDSVDVTTGNITVQAADGETPIISASDGDAAVDIQQPDVIVEDFTIDGDSLSTGSAVIVNTGANNASVQDLTFTGGDSDSSASTGIAVLGVKNVTIEGNSFDNATYSTAQIFVGGFYSDAARQRTVNGESTPNDQIVALANSNDATEFSIDVQDSSNPSSQPGYVEYGIDLSNENVTTGNDGTVERGATIYGAQGDGTLRYQLSNEQGNVEEVDINANDNSPTTFAVEDEFDTEGGYELSVTDLSTAGNDESSAANSPNNGSTTINSAYEVVDENSSVTAGDSVVTGRLVDRGDNNVTGESVSLFVNGNKKASTTTNDDGTFTLDVDEENGDNYDSFSQDDYVTIRDDDGDIIYKDVPVTEEPAVEPAWSIDANRSSVPFEIPTTVELVVADENGNRITGDELTSTDVMAGQNGESVLTADIDNDAIEFIDTDGDSVEGENNAVTIDVEATNKSVPVNVTVDGRTDSAGNDDENDYATTQVAVGQEDQPEPATVNFDDQTTDGQTVTVDSVFIPNDGYVAIHNASLTNGNVQGSVIGVSEYLEGGQTYDDVQVTLFEGVPGVSYSQDTLQENQTLIAMPHMETNGNEEYNFITSAASEDGPYTNNGGAVTDSASITVEQDQPPKMGDISAEDSQAFGDVTVGQTTTKAVTVTNDGNAPVTVSVFGINVNQGSPTEFSVTNTGDDDRSFTLGAGESEDLTVTFAPTSEGPKTANLYVNTENDGSTTTSLSGSATVDKKTLRIEGTGNYAFYSFMASGDVELTETDSEEQVAGSSATGAVGPGSDTYTFTGDLTKFYLDGDAKVFVNGEQKDVSGLESTLSFNGDNSVTSYNFEVKNGEITGSQSLTKEDNIDDADDRASGAVGPGTDSYRFTGTFQGLDTDNGATVVLNGIPIKPSLFYNTITFEGQGSYASYNFDVSGEVKDTGGLSKEDTISGQNNQVEGAISSGADTYVYSGSLDDLNTDGDIVIVRNGQEINENYDDA